MRTCLACGEISPFDALDKVTSFEQDLWEEYFQLEPYGALRQNTLLALIAQFVHNLLSAGDRKLAIKDILPEVLELLDEPGIDTEAVKLRLNALSAAMKKARE